MYVCVCLRINWCLVLFSEKSCHSFKVLSVACFGTILHQPVRIRLFLQMCGYDSLSEKTGERVWYCYEKQTILCTAASFRISAAFFSWVSPGAPTCRLVTSSGTWSKRVKAFFLVPSFPLFMTNKVTSSVSPPVVAMGA